MNMSLKQVRLKLFEVFIASELDAIEQVPAGQDPKISRAKMPKKLPTFEKAQNKARCMMIYVLDASKSWLACGSHAFF